MASNMADQLHHLNLHKLCRICGALLTGRVVYQIEHYTERLEKAFRSKFSSDTEDIHPKRFCNNCYCKMVNTEDMGSVHSVEPILWQKHDSICTTCISVSKKSKGGRPSKKNSIKNSVWTPELLNSLYLLSPTDGLTSSISDLKLNLAANPAITEFICNICKDLLKRPLVLPCEHSFCGLCLTGHLSKGEKYCPTCQQVIPAKNLIKP